MKTNQMNHKTTETRALVIVRSFNASKEQLFESWTDPEKVMKWWGPKGFTAPVCKIDLRVGGEYLFCTRSPEGQDFWSKGVYQEISVPHRIVATDSFSDAHGNIISASSVGLPGGWPSTLLITLHFDDDAGKTKLTLLHEGLPIEMLESCESAWNEYFDKLANCFE
jgi:uncharacterized protein YndB with AHSA1/START domain